jgi:hypothetical protein
VLAVVAVAYLFVANFPGAYHAIGTGLDASGRYALNYLSHSSVEYGRDVVFMYGPLAYLLNPVNIQSNIAQALILRLFIHALLIGVLLYYLLRRKSALPVILFVAAYWVACSVGIGFIEDQYEYSFLVIMPLLLCVSDREHSKGFIVIDILIGFLAASLLFMKFTLGVPALAMVTVSLIVRLAKNRQTARQAVLVIAGAYVLMTVVIGLVFFKSLSGLVEWFRGSADIAEGFSVAMSVGSWPTEFVIHALIALAIFLPLSLFLYISKSRTLHIALALSVSTFFTFKHGFVRQDEHTLFFYPFLLAALSVIILNSEFWKELALGGICFLIVLVLGLPVANQFKFLARTRVEERLWATEGRDNIRRLLNLDSVRHEVDRQSQANLQADRLPVEWVNLIKAGHESVGTLPWESVYCAANDLTWDPFPTVQMCVAYKASLDRMAAKHYQEGHGPGYLLVDFVDIDGRNLLLDTPATWRAILQNYRVIEKQTAQGVHLFQKTSAAAPEPNLAVIGQEQFRIGEWITLPPAEGLLYSFIDMRLRIPGFLSRISFRIPPVTIDIWYASGKIKTYRLIPDTAQNGPLINYTPNDMKEFDDLLAHVANDRVIKIRISGPGAHYYHQDGEIVWKEDSSYAVAYPPDSGETSGVPPQNK